MTTEQRRQYELSEKLRKLRYENYTRRKNTGETPAYIAIDEQLKEASEALYRCEYEYVETIIEFLTEKGE